MKKSALSEYFPLIAVIFLAILVLVKIDSIWTFMDRLFTLLLPFWYALILYYVFARPIRFLTKSFHKLPLFAKGQRAKIPAVLITYGLFIGFVALVVLLVVPSFQRNLTDFFINFQYYVNSLNRLTSNLTELLQEKKIDPAFINNLQQRFSEIGGTITSFGLNFARGLVSNLASLIGNFFLALILSVYLIIGDESIRSRVKRLLTALSGSSESWTMHVARLADETFYAYFYVQLTEAILLSLLCFIVFHILQIPYTVVLSVIIMFMGMVPVVGAWLAAFVGAALIFLVSPGKLLLFLIAYILTQQIEGNVIYPKRVGTRIGLPGLLVILAVLLGGGFGGVNGALFAVPLVSILYQLVKEWTEARELA